MGVLEVLERTQKRPRPSAVTPVTPGVTGRVTATTPAMTGLHTCHTCHTEDERGHESRRPTQEGDPKPAAVDVDAVLEQAARGTEVSPALLRAALTEEDLEEIRRGQETAETLHGIAQALPETPGLLELARRRQVDAVPAAEEAAEEPAEPTGTDPAEVARLARTFYNHIAACERCRPGYGNYCEDGERLHREYSAAAAQCSAPPWQMGMSAGGDGDGPQD